LVNQTRNTKKETETDLLGTWNIRIMMQAGKMYEIAAELGNFKLDIVALQEIRWKDANV